MPRQFTTEEVIAKYREIHGNRYDYSLVDYSGATKKVTIICPEHGAFDIQSGNHMTGYGCITCGRIKRHRRGVCDKHGEYVRGRGCVPCRTEGKRIARERSFVTEAQQRHGNKYSYDDTTYTTMHSPVDIRCNTCATTCRMTPSNHLLGSGGCRTCQHGGFSAMKRGVVYVLASGDLYKVGVTNKSAQKRAKDVSRSSGRVFTVVAEWEFQDGHKCLEAEESALSHLRSKYKQPVEVFNGYTECFYADSAVVSIARLACQAVS